MGDNSFIRFHGCSLDPRAAEFRPTYPHPYPNNPHHQLLPFIQPHIYYPYPPLPYPHFTPPPPPPAHITPDPPPPQLPPPSTTPSRTLLLSCVPTDVSESTVRRELEVFGDVRAVEMERVRDGMVTVHFYDIRNAKEALVKIQDQHMQQQFRLRMHFDLMLTTHHNSVVTPPTYGSNNNFPPPPPPTPPPARGLISGRAVWAQFIFPVTNGLPLGYNQGTIVIFNLDSNVSGSNLRNIFEAFGSIKELRETPLKRNQRFIEFYDTRNAAKALEEMNGKEICGKNVVIEFSRPGGHSKRFPRITHNQSVTNYPQLPPPPQLPLPPSPRKFSVHSPPYRPSRCIYNPQSNFLSKKANGNGGKSSRTERYRGDRVGAAMCSLSLSEKEGGMESRACSKKTGKKGQCTPSVASSTSSVKPYPKIVGGGSFNKPWKGSRHGKDKYDPRFLINEDGTMLESNCRDSRTTVMIKNIPNKYSQKLLLNMLDNHCIHCNEQIADGDDQHLSSYDFVYLPIDFINKCNVGYGFVNMTSPEATWRLYKAFHHQNWEVFNSRKICQVTYARLQGVEALKEHFRNSKFPSEADEYMPVVFSPPRDGRQLTDPTPIVGRDTTSPFIYQHHHHHHHRRQSHPSSSPVTSEDYINGSNLLPPLLLLDPTENPANSDSYSPSSNSGEHINDDNDGDQYDGGVSGCRSNATSSCSTDG